MAMARRKFLVTTAASVGTFATLANARVRCNDNDDSDEQNDEGEEISAAEDLMREHGVLNRILLIFEEGLRRMGNHEDIPPEVFQTTATLVRKFVEDYHEKLEEQF